MSDTKYPSQLGRKVVSIQEKDADIAKQFAKRIGSTQWRVISALISILKDSPETQRAVLERIKAEDTKEKEIAVKLSKLSPEKYQEVMRLING